MLGFGALGELALGEGGDFRTFVSTGFSQPMRRRLTAAVFATTVAGFVPPPATTAPVFSSFSQPQKKPRFTFADQPTSRLIETEFVPPPQAQGGGTSRKLIEAEPVSETPRRNNRRTGFEPVKKLPPRSVHVVEPSIPLPPTSLVRSTPTVTDAPPPFELVDRDMIPRDLLALQAQIHAAEDATDIQDVLDILEMIDSGQLEI